MPYETDREVYVGRQAFFNSKQEVVAYELLYRNGNINACEIEDGDSETVEVLINSFLNIGLNILANGNRIFVKYTPGILKHEIASVIHPSKIVIEISAKSTPTESMLSDCRNLKQKGYSFAIDSFTDSNNMLPLIDLVDFIKVDFSSPSLTMHQNLIERFSTRNIKLIAKNIETPKEFQEALDLGYTYFQGFFFEYPIIVKGKKIHGHKLYLIKLMNEAFCADFSINRMEAIIDHDASLTYKLLLFINSASVGLPNKIKSIRQALVLLGQKEICKWLALLMLRNFGTNKPDELLTVAVIRAKFCEDLAMACDQSQLAARAFLAGILSLADVLMERPFEKIISLMSLDDEIASALLGEKNKLRDMLDLAIALERGEWERVIALKNCFELTSEQINSIYWTSVDWESKLPLKG